MTNRRILAHAVTLVAINLIVRAVLDVRPFTVEAWTIAGATTTAWALAYFFAEEPR
jgi:hypothetical protein